MPTFTIIDEISTYSSSWTGLNNEMPKVKSPDIFTGDIVTNISEMYHGGFELHEEGQIVFEVSSMSSPGYVNVTIIDGEYLKIHPEYKGFTTRLKKKSLKHYLVNPDPNRFE